LAYISEECDGGGLITLTQRRFVETKVRTFNLIFPEKRVTRGDKVLGSWEIRDYLRERIFILWGEQ